MKKYMVTVVEEDKMFDTIAWTGGQMASGEKTWEFDGMDENGIYIARRMLNNITGKVQYVLFKQ